MFIIKYSYSLKIYINVSFDIIKPGNKKNLVPVPQIVANFSWVDKWQFGPARYLKFFKT